MGGARQSHGRLQEHMKHSNSLWQYLDDSNRWMMCMVEYGLARTCAGEDEEVDGLTGPRVFAPDRCGVLTPWAGFVEPEP